MYIRWDYLRYYSLILANIYPLNLTNILKSSSDSECELMQQKENKKLKS